jgi:hypothetical protein
MKILSAFVLACALAYPTFAEESGKKTVPSASSDQEKAAMTAMPVTTAELKAPFVLKDGAISQPQQTDVAAGGRAIFKFTAPKAGAYVIHAIANAPDEDSNSFFLNIDAEPQDPEMIWDIEVTKGFEERVVSWRGSGDTTSDEFAPKRFTLTAGEHKLIIVGREPAQLKSVSIRPAAN